MLTSNRQVCIWAGLNLLEPVHGITWELQPTDQSLNTAQRRRGDFSDGGTDILVVSFLTSSTGVRKVMNLCIYIVIN